MSSSRVPRFRGTGRREEGRPDCVDLQRQGTPQRVHCAGRTFSRPRHLLMKMMGSTRRRSRFPTTGRRDFTRGHTMNRGAGSPIRTAAPGVERAIWAVKCRRRPLVAIDRGEQWRRSRLTADTPRSQRTAKSIACPVASGPRTNESTKVLKPFIASGARMPTRCGRPITQACLRQQPHGSRFIAVYDVRPKDHLHVTEHRLGHRARPGRPTAGDRVHRRPGTPSPSSRSPAPAVSEIRAGPAYNPLNPNRAAGSVAGGGFGPGRGITPGRGGRGNRATRRPDQRGRADHRGIRGRLHRRLWVADVATGEAREFWHNATTTRFSPTFRPFSGRPTASFSRSSPRSGPASTRCRSMARDMTAPVSLTPQDGQIETDSLSPDGKYLYYGTNATDIERRHIWRVATSGGVPERVTMGEAIEHDPVLTARGAHAGCTQRRLEPAAVGRGLQHRRTRQAHPPPRNTRSFPS